MKRHILWATGALAIGLAINAPAYTGWGIGAGYWNTADAGDDFAPVLKIGLEAGDGVQLELRASRYGSLGESVDGRNVDLEVTPLEAGLALELPLAERASAYIGGGGGYYLMDASVQGPGPGADTGDEWGFYFSAGAEWVVRTSQAFYGGTQASLFAEAMYRSVSAGDIGGRSVDLDGLGANAGLMIRW